MTELEKIDLIRERTGVGYSGAQALLEAAGGDVVQALIQHEESEDNNSPQAKVVAALQGLIRQGNVTRLRVRKGDRTYLEIPLTAGVIGAALAPQLFLIAGVACIVGRCSVDFQRAEDAESNEWHPVSFEEPTP